MTRINRIKHYSVVSFGATILVAGVIMPSNPAAAAGCQPSNLTELNNCWSNGGVVTLINDISSHSRLVDPGGAEKSVTLNLNGHTLNSDGGITVSEDHSLTINGPGVLVAQATEAGAAGIGGTNSSEDSGNIVINGGNISASGTVDAAGIGGGRYGLGFAVINGGAVHSVGGSSAAGIGSGYNQNNTQKNSIVKIHGGSVTTIGGGTGAGIGTGATDNGGALIEITNGNITAFGGQWGAGIGGGYNTAGANVTIAGGSVTATGGTYGAGIGSGLIGLATDPGTVLISNGTVVAQGGNNSAGIGGGSDGKGFDVTVRGGSIKAIGGTGSTASKSGVGIGSGIHSVLPIAPGSLDVQGSLHPSSTLTNGGKGYASKEALVPNISFQSKPNFAFLVTPVNSGVPNGAGSIWIRRGVLPQHPKAGAWPKSVKKKGTTVLNVANAKTQEGLPLSAKVSISKKYNKSKCLKWYRKSNRYLAVKTTGKCSLRFKVTYTAPKSTWNSAYKATKSYKVKR